MNTVLRRQHRAVFVRRSLTAGTMAVEVLTAIVAALINLAATTRAFADRARRMRALTAFGPTGGGDKPQPEAQAYFEYQAGAG